MLCWSLYNGVRNTFNNILEEEIHKGKCASGPAESLEHGPQPGLPAGNHLVGTSSGVCVGGGVLP